MATKSFTQNFLESKLFIALLLVVLFGAGYMIARAKYKPQIKELNRLVQEKAMQVDSEKANGNKVMMVDGKMLIYKNGIAKELESDLMLPSGDKISVDGIFTKADGTRVLLQNGEAVDMYGKMIEKEK